MCAASVVCLSYVCFFLFIANIHYMFRPIGHLQVYKWTLQRNRQFSCQILYSLSGLALSYAANTGLYNLWLLSAQFVTSSYTYGKLKALCKSLTCVHLGKFPVGRRTLFCRHCNF
jgi:hypothetical protein